MRERNATHFRRVLVVSAGLATFAATSACATVTKTASRPKSQSSPKSVTSTQASTSTRVVGARAVGADRTVDVRFDTPGANPRPIAEAMVNVTTPIDHLTMNVTNITYRGLVCGFSFRAKPPISPVTIEMKGVSPATRFDSGRLTVSWTSLDAHQVKADSGGGNGWNFSAEAHVNRNGPGWVIELGGVTAEATNAVPTFATCELRLSVALNPGNGPIGYWAGFASV